jgi:two-component system chemotaxis response regulator CheB
MAPINVLIVDDSAIVRQVLADILQQDPDIKIMGKASDPIFAMRRMERQWPDVIVLDVEMPRMDGITFLRQIMGQRPTPVVICSTLTDKGADTTLQALSAGAIDIITKPKIGLKSFLQEEHHSLIHAVKAAAQAKVARLAGKQSTEPRRVQSKQNADVIVPPVSAGPIKTTTEKVVVIGTSTGGTQALEAVLTRLPRVAPGIAIVQHMPERFTRSFAERLNSLCQIEVREAVEGDRIIPGRALIAPGGRHLLLQRSGAKYQAQVKEGPVVNRHRPSVDVLFRSAAQCAGKNAMGIIMTGMGNDGAAGMEEMYKAGAYTIAQDEDSCVVFGMPKEAIKRKAVDKVVPLDVIVELIMDYASVSEIEPARRVR